MLKTLERPAIAVVGLAIRTRPMSPGIPALWPKFVARIDEIENLSEPRVSYGVMRHGGGDMEDLHYMAAVAVTGSRSRGCARRISATARECPATWAWCGSPVQPR